MLSNDLMAFCQTISDPEFLIAICQKNVKNSLHWISGTIKGVATETI